jgi:steroid 5-alpha reductase family enzyme
MHNVLTLLLQGSCLMGTLMAALWWIQKWRIDASHVDVAWAAGLGILAIFYAVAADGYPPRRLLLAVLVGVWSFRLATYPGVTRCDFFSSVSRDCNKYGNCIEMVGMDRSNHHGS